MSLFADYNLPFAAALGFMLILAVIQLVGIGDFDFDADVEIDADVDLDVDANASGGLGMADGLFSLIGFGRLPLVMWLALVLFLFAGVGVGVQQLADSFLGAPFGPLLASVIAGACALPLAGGASRALASILPQDETSAVKVAALVGRRAQISVGTARRGYPARAQVKDRFGQVHNVMVEPHDATAELREGDEILLVRREGETFFAVEVQDRRLAPAD